MIITLATIIQICYPSDIILVPLGSLLALPPLVGSIAHGNYTVIQADANSFGKKAHFFVYHHPMCQLPW